MAPQRSTANARKYSAPTALPKMLTGSFILVAPIAYHCSDLVLSVQPSLDLDSQFYAELQHLNSKQTHSIVSSNQKPEVKIEICKTEINADSRIDSDS
jgi:hypothetical protein